MLKNLGVFLGAVGIAVFTFGLDFVIVTLFKVEPMTANDAVLWYD